MLELETSKTLSIPTGVTLTLDSSIVTVSGPLGSITRDFSHTNLFFSLISTSTSTNSAETEKEEKIEGSGKEIKVFCYLSRKKRASLVTTVSTHISNMIKGVLYGFSLKLVAMNSFFTMDLEYPKDA